MCKRIVSLLGLVMACLGALVWLGPHPLLASPQVTVGTIAYVVPDDTTGDQIWLIEPDGSHNRKVYSIGKADPYSVEFMLSLAWRPDAGELIFASNHEEACSWYNYDVYAIQPDGSGYRRVTNSPHCAALASLPQGKVVVDTTGGYGNMVYVQGAPQVKSDYGTSVTFDNVADLGNVLQPIVGIFGLYRVMAGGVHVTAGQTVSVAAGYNTTPSDSLGAFHPVWKSDGTRIGYAFGCAALFGIPDHPPAGSTGTMLLSATTGVTPCLMAYGPTPATVNEFVYFSNTGEAYGFYSTTEGGGAGTRVVTTDLGYVFQVQYLPDASGFIYTIIDSSSSSNLYRYDFAADTVTPLTAFTNEYARDFTLSPDGKTILFERAPEELMQIFGGASDLWTIGTDGSNPRLFKASASHPSWSLRAPPARIPLFLPLIRR